MPKWKQTAKILFRNSAILVVGLIPFILVQVGHADPTYKSTNYGVDEVFMGAGGLTDANSDTYQARASLGDIVVGNSGSTSYQVYGGYTTTSDPYLEFYIPSVSANLGLLSSDSPAVTTATFTIRTYLASGYVIISNSEPPRNSSYLMQALSSQAASSAGTEQFGINLAANNLAGIGDFGAAPSQIPDATFSYGYATATYDDSNLFKYVEGDTIAQSDSSSGTTDFTISYLFNISDVTPGGLYTFTHDLVAIPYF